MTPPEPSPSVLVAMSAFKGTLSNVEATDAVCLGLSRAGARPIPLPIGDGGAGTAEAIRLRLGGELIATDTQAPGDDPLQATALAIPSRANPKLLYFESSQTCGYTLGDQKRPMEASSRGLGLWIRECVHRHANPDTPITIGLGDSAISDGGTGMLQGLGFTLLDQKDRHLRGSAQTLRLIRKILPPPTPLLNPITVLCDVQNPLLGKHGSAPTFAPQKGASEDQVEEISAGLHNLVACLAKAGFPLSGKEPMTGSAGGLSAAFRACLAANLVHGAPFLLDWLDFDGLLSQAEWVISGEGRTDCQSRQGKAPHVCLTRAKERGKKTFLLSGSLEQPTDTLCQEWGLTRSEASGLHPTPAEALATKAHLAFT